MSRIGLAMTVVVVALAAPVPPVTAQVVKREPPMGALKPGERVLIDDGSCGAGKIKEVIGGDHIKVGGRSNIVRQRRCIPR